MQEQKHARNLSELRLSSDLLSHLAACADGDSVTAKISYQLAEFDTKTAGQLVNALQRAVDETVVGA